MTTKDLPPSGTIKQSEVIAEFGKGNNLLDYLGEGGVTSSAPLKLTDFYGKAAGPRPPELIGGTGHFYQWGTNGNSQSHTFNIPVSAGDTVVLCIASGNTWTGNYIEATVNGENTVRHASFFSSTHTGYPGVSINHVVLANASSNISVTITCTRPLYSPSVYMFVLGGSFVRKDISNAHGVYAYNNGGWAYIKNGNLTREVTENNLKFVVSVNCSNSNYTNGWYSYNHKWASGGGTEKFDYLAKHTSQKNNHSQGAYRALPEGEIIEFEWKGTTLGSNAFAARKYTADTTRRSPAEIMSEQFAIQEMEMAAEAERLKNEPTVPEPPDWEDE